jgi:hypothetical protein
VTFGLVVMIKATSNLCSASPVGTSVGVLIDGVMCSRDRGVSLTNHSVVKAKRNKVSNKGINEVSTTVNTK